MCGISGALSTRRGGEAESLVRGIVHDQSCRGPDAHVVRELHNDAFEVALGHNRLSIIDLRPEANQPMVTAGSVLQVVFNGEIYNFLELRAELASLGRVFGTRSDTEVILAAYLEWGAAAFDRFIGMFAIALYDAASRELVLVRDRFGVKPLYYWTDGVTFAFASTPKVIARHAGLKPNLAYVSCGIRYKFYEDDSSISQYDGLHALEPSHVLNVRCRDGRFHLSKTRFYDLERSALALVDQLERQSEGELEERLLELLRSATLLRQRSDVPLGLSVSGGVDSSAIAALLSENLDRVIGYSYSHPRRATSEGPSVVELAKATRMEPRWVWLEDAASIGDLFWKTLAAQDAPFPHASIMAQNAVFRAARDDGTIVLLGGQGGDEGFMGYRKFFLFYAQSLFRQRRLRDVPHFVSAIVPFVPPVIRRAGVFLAERKRYTGATGGMGSSLALPDPAATGGMGLAAGQSPRTRQMLDITRFSLPTLLRYEDRNSMGNSIESRLPFMDHRVLEFGLALPDRMKLGNGFGKFILRNALKGKVPESIRVNRDKRGFDVDQRGWIARGLGAELRSAITARRATISELLPGRRTISELFSDERLIADPQAFKEAVSLIWLGDRL
jgi:asparagine synthase (glutamine-hydrolysing)